MAPQDTPRKILFLAANPKDTGRLRLDEEIRNIQEGLKLSSGRHNFELITQWAVRRQDLRRALLEYAPQIVHFSGHGAGKPGLILEDDAGNAQLIPAQVLSRLFKLCPSVECVLLNACYSKMQAMAITHYVPQVIGMNQAIGDATAIQFAVGFYDALGYGRAYEEAYEFGMTAISAEPIVIRRDVETSPESEILADPAPVTPIFIQSTGLSAGTLSTGTLSTGFSQPIAMAAKSPARRSRQAHRDSPKERQRQILLNKVRNFWIKGVLESSLHNRVRIELDLVEQPDAIAHPWQTVWETPESTQPVPLPGQQTIDQFDELGEGRTLLILGEPGSGKTTTLLTLVRDLLLRAEQTPSHPIPVVFNLSSWLPKGSLAEWLEQELSTKYQVSRSLGQVWIREQQLLLLLDGLDEVSRDRQDACVLAINQFHQDHGQTEIVVCSRSLDYQRLVHKLAFQAAITLQPLSPAQVQRYIQQVGSGLSAVNQLLDTDPALQTLVRSPLMLSIMALAYQDFSVDVLPQLDLDARRNHLFSTYVQRMLSRHGSEGRYTQAQTCHWLTQLARAMQQHGETVFLVERMQPTWLKSLSQQRLYAASVGVLWSLIWGLIAVIVWEPVAGIKEAVFTGIYTWLMFSALASLAFIFEVRPLAWLPQRGTKRLAITIAIELTVGVALGILLILGLVGFRVILFADQIPLGQSVVWGLFFGMTTGIIWGIMWGFLEPRHKIQPFETLTWSWKKFWTALFKGLQGGLLMGIGFGVFFEFSFWLIAPLSSDVAYVPMQGLWLGLWGSVFWNVMWQLIVGLKGANIEKSTITNQGIWQAGRNTLIYALIAGLLTGFIGVFVEGIPALWMGGLLGGLVGSALPGMACIQHFVLRILLYFQKRFPWNLSRFLEDAVERLFLQKVGGGYIFIHRLLMEHFSQLEGKSD